MSGGASACCTLRTAGSFAPRRITRTSSAGPSRSESPPALEVLTIIAYYQPTTRAYVDQIRGVDSAYTMGLLQERKLIEECGRLQVPGRPHLYRTTKQFLRAFHLTSLDDLPEIPDLAADGQMRINQQGEIVDPGAAEQMEEASGEETP